MVRHPPSLVVPVVVLMLPVTSHELIHIWPYSLYDIVITLSTVYMI
jgi:hypothetical protein